MRIKRVGGVEVSALGLGTWQFGSRAWGYGDAYAERTAIQIVRRALDLGVNLIDTAEIYALGRSETIVGQAIRDRREEAFVATKLFPVLPIAPIVPRRARASARRLGIDRIDLYQLHAANPLIPVSQAMTGMRAATERGLIRHVGVSNLSLGQWQRAETALGAPVLSNQVRFSLAVRDPEAELLPWAQAADRLVIAYSPLAQGMLSGAYDGREPPPGYRSKNPMFSPENQVRARPLITAVLDLAQSYDVAATTIALAWLVAKPNVVAIPGARTLAQLEQNLIAGDLELTPGELADLDAVSAGFAPTAVRQQSRLGGLRRAARPRLSSR